MNATEIAAALSTRAEDVCRRYLPRGRKQGRYWTAGDTSGANPRGRVTRFDATDWRPVDKWTAAPRPTTSPQGQKPQQKRSTHMVHKPVNSECSRQGED